jgi:hypothetical protein
VLQVRDLGGGSVEQTHAVKLAAIVELHFSEVLHPVYALAVPLVPLVDADALSGPPLLHKSGTNIFKVLAMITAATTHRQLTAATTHRQLTAATTHRQLTVATTHRQLTVATTHRQRSTTSVSQSDPRRKL